MLFPTVLLALAATPIIATPLALPQGTGTGADSCPSDPLSKETWMSLKLDDFLLDTAKNLTVAPTNNVQAVADYYGAPNFFCGLDNFCNAGQPCLPVEIPAWYVMVAMQNWNNYMNSLNTAIGFATSIISMTVPGIIRDFWPRPVDNVTPFVAMSKMITTALGMVPLTGAVKHPVSGSINQATRMIRPPTGANLFMEWSNIAKSLATALTDWQASVSTAIKTTLDAKVDEPDVGIFNVIKGGEFLGLSQNFTQSDLQAGIIDSLTVYTISLVLQAQLIFVYRVATPKCKETNSAMLCVPDGNGKFGLYWLLQPTGGGASVSADYVMDTLINKYGFTKQEVLVGVTGCFDNNGKRQLADPFGDQLPLDPKTQCLFNLQVCGANEPGFYDKDGIVEGCKAIGANV
ncbi:hypothetical protein LZ554_008673 [Drepanopeziza brunnea f. sp. 'monogermtubi']|nr:hypothetical protein LZ554_008673 [Drepanopeziza brunnea f. sp. 'monogermtubi']